MTTQTDTNSLASIEASLPNGSDTPETNLQAYT